MKISLIGLTLDIFGEATFLAPIYLGLTFYLNNAFESFFSIILENLEREYVSPWCSNLDAITIRTFCLFRFLERLRNKSSEGQ